MNLAMMGSTSALIHLTKVCDCFTVHSVAVFWIVSDLEAVTNVHDHVTYDLNFTLFAGLELTWRDSSPQDSWKLGSTQLSSAEEPLSAFPVVLSLFMLDPVWHFFTSGCPQKIKSVLSRTLTCLHRDPSVVGQLDFTEVRAFVRVKSSEAVTDGHPT